MKKVNKLIYGYREHTICIEHIGKTIVISIDNNHWSFPAMNTENAKKIIKEYIDKQHKNDQID